MIKIKRHGVVLKNGLSYAQKRLQESSAKIRICSAPTGAGKTYAFSALIKQKRQRVFFIVPTQALAKDIQQTLSKQKIMAFVWDYNQTRKILDEDQDEQPWQVRKQEIEALQAQGGMIIATPEALARLTLAIPRLKKVVTEVNKIWEEFDHIVFDESHSLTVQSYGLLYFWSAIIAVRHQHNLMPTPCLNVLSATQSDMIFQLFNEKLFQTQNLVEVIDEKISEDTNARIIHGDVELVLTENHILETAILYGKQILDSGQKLLLLYDNLKELVADEVELSDYFNQECGLLSQQIIMINGQDRQANYSQGSSYFNAGNYPEAKHKVIIATSAIEMGVNLPDLNVAIINYGKDPASFLQRVGRVARGDCQGTVYCCNTANKSKPSYIAILSNISDEVNVETLRQALSPLRTINQNQAKALASAYWSMLSRKQHSLVKALKSVVSDIDPQITMFGQQLDMIRKIKVGKRYSSYFEKWITAIDQLLQEVRGFAPTIRLQFAGGDIVTYSVDWVVSYLEEPDEWQDDLWIYHRHRDDYIRDKINKNYQISVLTPVGEKGGINYQNRYQEYIHFLKHDPTLKRQISKTDKDKIIKFITDTRLIPRSDPSKNLLQSEII